MQIEQISLPRHLPGRTNDRVCGGGDARCAKAPILEEKAGNFSRVRLWPLLLVVVTACAPLPAIPKRPNFRVIEEPADKLQTYYNWRLTPSDEGGYNYGKLHITQWRLAQFMDAQGDSVAANWAGKGNAFITAGWGLAGAMELAAIGISLQAGGNDPAKGAWWITALPAGLLGWTFQWAGDGWFRRPAAAKYNLELKRELGLTKD